MANDKNNIKPVISAKAQVVQSSQFDIALYTQEDIQSHIYTVRGQHVMLDSDIARLYSMETRRINEQVKRNPIKFPERYVFQLTAEEVELLKSQNATSNPLSRSQDATLNIDECTEGVENQKEMLMSSRSQNATLNAEDTLKSQKATSKTARGKNIKYLPYAFTERGASMLATVIKGEAAAHISVRIMDAFFAMRDFLRANAPMLQRLTNLEQNLLQTNNILLSTLEHQQVTDQQLQDLHTSQKQLQQQVANVQSVLEGFQQSQPAPLMGIYFDGQTFDAFQLVQQLIRKATSRIVLIDSYVNDTVLARLTERNPGVTCDIYLQTGRYYNAILPAVEAHNLQYPTAPINVHEFQRSHDRFLIIDDEVYHFGASIKDLGKRWFGVNLITEYSADDLIARL